MGAGREVARRLALLVLFLLPSFPPRPRLQLVQFTTLNLAAPRPPPLHFSRVTHPPKPLASASPPTVVLQKTRLRRIAVNMEHKRKRSSEQVASDAEAQRRAAPREAMHDSSESGSEESAGAGATGATLSSQNSVISPGSSERLASAKALVASTSTAAAAATADLSQMKRAMRAKRRQPRDAANAPVVGGGATDDAPSPPSAIVFNWSKKIKQRSGLVVLADHGPAQRRILRRAQHEQCVGAFAKVAADEALNDRTAVVISIGLREGDASYVTSIRMGTAVKCGATHVVGEQRAWESFTRLHGIVVSVAFGRMSAGKVRRVRLRARVVPASPHHLPLLSHCATDAKPAPRPQCALLLRATALRA